MGYYFDLSTLDLSKSRVRCNGKSLDKCSLSNLIRECALRSGHPGYTLWSDIYWDSASYSELRSLLLDYLIKLGIV